MIASKPWKCFAAPTTWQCGQAARCQLSRSRCPDDNRSIGSLHPSSSDETLLLALPRNLGVIESFWCKRRVECCKISIVTRMSFARRLKIRSIERNSTRDAIRLVFARPDYDCRRDLPRSLQYEKWRAIIADRFRDQIKALIGRP